MQGFGQGEPPVGRLDGLDRVWLVIRSADDPYTFAMAQTADSGDFGSTSKEQLVIGLIGLGFGLLLALPAVAHCYSTWRLRHELHMRVEVAREGEWAELSKLRQSDNL